MKIKVIGLFLLLSMMSAVSSAAGYVIKVRIIGLGSDTCYLGGYYGQYNQVNDTVISNARGEMTFTGPDALPGGIYFIIHNKTRLFEFVIDKEQNISFETDTVDYVGHMKISGSRQNSDFYDYLLYINKQQSAFGVYKSRYDQFKDQKDSADYYQKKLTEIDELVKSYKKNFIEQHPDYLIAKVFNASREPDVPEAPILYNGRKDSLFQYRYYKEHYFDFIDFSDDRMLRTPVFHERLSRYMTQVVVQTPDSINKEADILAARATSKELFKYIVWYVTYLSETSHVMGFDAIYIHMFDNYYNTGKAFWISEKILDNMTKRADKIRPNLLGVVAPNMIMQDTLLALRSMHDVRADYTILLFWDPECGHCQTEVPHVHEFYLKNKAELNLEVFAVCADTNMAAMKKFIRKHNLSWINVNGPRTLTKPYSELYDIYSTPVIYILDKKKIILAKRIPYDKLEEFIRNDIKRRTQG